MDLFPDVFTSANILITTAMVTGFLGSIVAGKHPENVLGDVPMSQNLFIWGFALFALDVFTR